jgi:hypothetical protein
MVILVNNITNKSHLTQMVANFCEEECLVLLTCKYKQEEIILNYRQLPVVQIANLGTRDRLKIIIVV